LFCWTLNSIYEYNGSTWDAQVPTEGYACWNEDTDRVYTFNGSNWVTFGSTVLHNNTSAKQGGTTNEYYHLTAAEHTVVGNTSGVNTGDQVSSDFTHNDLSGKQGGTTDEYYHLTSSEHTAVQAMVAAAVQNLTTAEVSQLANINSVTISNTQWGYVGAMNQGVASSDSPTFNDLTVSNDFVVDTDTLYVDSANDRVGIGTRVPDAKLEIQNPGDGNGLLIDQNGNGVALNIDAESTSATAVEIIADSYTSLANAMYLHTNTKGFKIHQTSSLAGGSELHYDPASPTLDLYRHSFHRGATLRIGNANGGAFLYSEDGTFLSVYGTNSTEGDTELGGYQLIDALNDDAALRIGNNYLWVDSTGDLRIKSSEPTSDTDGTVVGTQS
jgi:hypothetical protein